MIHSQTLALSAPRSNVIISPELCWRGFPSTVVGHSEMTIIAT